MAPTLRPYQRDAVDFLASVRTGLYAADPGLGKTLVSMTAARQIGAERVLVGAPAVALVSWRAEARKWAPNTPFKIVRRLSDLPATGPCIAVLSYGLIQMQGPKSLALAVQGVQPFDVLVLDEAHFLKDGSTKRTAAIYGKGCDPVNGALVALAKRTWCLTGTPAPNHYAEVWTHLRALAPDRILGVNGRPLSYWQFMDRVCQTRPSPFGNGRQIVGSKNGRWLKERLAGFMLRHRKVDVARDLPPMSWVSVPLAVHHKGAALPDGLTDDEVLAHVAADPSWPGERRALGAAKAAPAASWVSNLLDAGASKVIVFALHHDVLDSLQADLRAYGVVRVDGKTSLALRDAAVSAFQQDPDQRVFLGQTLAAGTALTLTAASDVVMVEMHPTPGHNAQAAQRAHRLGQTNPVTVHVLHADGTSDERVSEILARKSADLAVVFD